MSRARVLAEMVRQAVDVLLLGRDANARYASGVERLWLAGTRPFVPGCVVVAATGDVHLMSTTDVGVPADVPRDHLYPPSWNPARVVQHVVAVPGVSGATRIGVDGLGPTFEALLTDALPDADLVDGEVILRRVRAVKSPVELVAIRAAVVVAEAAMDAARRDLDPKTAFLAAMADSGVTTPAFEPLVRRHDGTVSIDAGVLCRGWEASLGRSWPRGPRWAEVDAAIGRCRAGAPVAAVGHVDVYGLGLGYEALEPGSTLQEAMVLSVGVPGHREMVLVTADAPEVLTLLSRR